MGSEYSNNNNNLRYPAGYQNIKPIIIETKKFDYFIDECVEGTITLQNQAPMVLSDIYLDLFLLENWVCKENDNQSYSDINRQPLLCVKVGINKILKIESDLINLSAGYFHFPFKFRLPVKFELVLFLGIITLKFSPASKLDFLFPFVSVT